MIECGVCGVFANMLLFMERFGQPENIRKANFHLLISVGISDNNQS